MRWHRLVAAIACFVAAGCGASLRGMLPDSAAAATVEHGWERVRTGAIVPLYFDPDRSWDVLVRARQTHPRVPILAIVNPSSGPGPARLPAYAAAIAKLRRAGVRVIGYVTTSYAARPAAVVAGEMRAYAARYHVDGIFFDEMADAPGAERYYAALSSTAHHLGMRTTFGNPGTAISAGYAGTVDGLVVYEGDPYPAPAFLAAQRRAVGPGTAALVDGVTRNRAKIAAIAVNVAYLYVATSGKQKAYGSLPAAFGTFIADLDASEP